LELHTYVRNKHGIFIHDVNNKAQSITEGGLRFLGTLT